MPAEDRSSPDFPAKCPTCGRGYRNAQAEAAFDAVSGYLTCNRCGSGLDMAGLGRLEFEYLVRRNQERLRLEAVEVRRRPRMERRAAEFGRARNKEVAAHERWLKRCGKIVAAERERRQAEAEREDRARRERDQMLLVHELLRFAPAQAKARAGRERQANQLHGDRERTPATVAEATEHASKPRRRRNPDLLNLCVDLVVFGTGIALTVAALVHSCSRPW